MAWDDTQTASDSITYTEWNNMVTAINAKVTTDILTGDSMIVSHSGSSASDLPIAASRIVGRGSSGSISALTAANVRTLLSLDLAENTMPVYHASDTPSALSIAASRIVGRASSGSIAALTAAQVNTITGAIANIVEDTTPQLGGNLDLNSYGLTMSGSAGETLVAGESCFLDSDGKFWLTDASSSGSTAGLIGLSLSGVAADGDVTVLLKGQYTTTGLTTGSQYFVGLTSGSYGTTAPSSSGEQIRLLGYAISTTEFFVDPDKTYIEV